MAIILEAGGKEGINISGKVEEKELYILNKGYPQSGKG